MLFMMSNLGALHVAQGKYHEAEPLLTRSVELQTRVIGDVHQNTLTTMNTLSDLYMREGKYGQAELLLTKVLEIARRTLSRNDRYTALAVYNLACVAARRGRHEQALSLLRQALNHGLTAWAANHMDKDSDLDSLHSDPRFIALVAEAQQRAAAAARPK